MLYLCYKICGIFATSGLLTGIRGGFCDDELYKFTFTVYIKYAKFVFRRVFGPGSRCRSSRWSPDP